MALHGMHKIAVAGCLQQEYLTKPIPLQMAFEFRAVLLIGYLEFEGNRD